MSSKSFFIKKAASQLARTDEKEAISRIKMEKYSLLKTGSVMDK
tara:strand:- start:886 stop:1017 length:132 start_codon:yes stop_codon:yes gene_type:complete